MHGIQRLPTEPECTTDKIMLNSYEILPREPLHDVKDHINLYKEISYHAENREEKILLQTQYVMSWEISLVREM